MIRNNILFFLYLKVLLLFTLCDGHCPADVDITPCECTEISLGAKLEVTVTCAGQIGLPKLTTILTKRLCGYHINKLRLFASDINYLPSNIFYKLQIDDVGITSTNISHFTQAGRSAFYGLERTLKSLSMRNCRLVDGLHWEKIGELDVLDSLDLSKNDLTTIPLEWFKYPPRNLKSLHLSGNKIEEISSGALSSMHNLLHIDLSENAIFSLSREVFPHPGNSIIILKLSYNKLTYLEENFFDEMFGLRRLYLDNNRLQSLDSPTWKPIWNQLQVLDVMGNELMCDCNMEWISRLYPIQNFYGSCSSESQFPKREIQMLWPWDFNCTSTLNEL